MPITQIPPVDSLRDGQFVQIQGPDGITISYHYDQQQRALYFKESQVVYPSNHGLTHIAEDPIPPATCDTPGLLSANDKCKLEALTQTRVGVIGFQGAGFADDGGWISGDIVLAAGSEFISLERIGNVVRFTVDSPIPLTCNCEDCNQIFWVQDETEIASIRPPTCSGKLPGVNGYGEFKIYLFPESTIADPVNTSTTLNNKGKYPSFIFKRYDDALVPGSGELDIVLKRNNNNQTTTEIGWAFTPGASGKVECVWLTGTDRDGNVITFELDSEIEPNLLGGLLYKGHSITRRPAVIVDYTDTTLSTNTYTLRFWDVNGERAIADKFTAKNIWQYQNPENSTSGANPKSLIVDNVVDLLPIGTVVDVWFYQIGELNNTPIRRYFFSKKPSINPNHMWSWVGQIGFGDIVVAKQELLAGPGSEDKDSAVAYSAYRDIEDGEWGVTGSHDPVISFDDVAVEGTAGADISTQHRAVIDTSLPGLRVTNSNSPTSDYSERPVYVWNRTNLNNALLKLKIGAPQSSNYTPYDIVIRSQIDKYTECYMQVMEKGIVNGVHFIRVKGCNFKDLPPFGTVRVISNTNNNLVFNYNRKFAFPSFLSGEDGVASTDYPGPSELLVGSIILTGGAVDNVPYLGSEGDILELVHQEYSSNVVRVEFSYDSGTGLQQVQFKVGYLDMSLPYEEDLSANDLDDFVRGLAPGYAVSAIYSQSGLYSGVGTQPTASPSGFVLYTGGAVVGGDKAEYWNELDIMVRDGQVWIWWNKLLVPPSKTLSSALASPVNIDTPYFNIDVDEFKAFGKYGIRMFPGATLRSFDLRTQLTMYSEFSLGQLQLI